MPRIERHGKRRLRWLAAGVVVVAIIGGTILASRGHDPSAATAPVVRLTETRHDATPPAAAPVVVGASAASAAPQPISPHQQIELSLANAVERHCVSATRAVQTGSVRRYELAAEGVSNWSLSVDTVSGQVTAARLRSGQQNRATCTAPACAGFAIGRPDAHGMRRLQITDAELQGADADKRGVRLNASLLVPPDSQSLALACRVPAVIIVENDGALTEFCPMGGMGFEVDDAGRYRYVFRSLEDQRLTVLLDAGGALVAISFGRFTCRAAACAGASSASADLPGAEEHPRRFDFSGVNLFHRDRPDAKATLNGQFLMPGQS